MALFIPGLHRFIGDNPVLLVGNKVDILPKSLKPKMVQWMRERTMKQDYALLMFY